MNTSYKHKKRLREEPCHESKQKDKEDRQCSKVAKKDPPFEENRSNHQEPNMNEPSFPYPVDDDGTDTVWFQTVVVVAQYCIVILFDLF